MLTYFSHYTGLTKQQKAACSPSESNPLTRAKYLPSDCSVRQPPPAVCNRQNGLGVTGRKYFTFIILPTPFSTDIV